MIRIRNIKLSLNEKENILKEKVSKKLKININKIKTIKINKKSLDARNKNNICYVYELDVKVENESKILTKIKSKDIFKTPNEVYKCIATGEKSIQNRPIIVGSGPSGLFAAYLLIPDSLLEEYIGSTLDQFCSCTGLPEELIELRLKGHMVF